MATATLMQAGDLAELVQAHQAGIWRYLRFLGCDDALADDLTQETFLTVYRKPFEERSGGATCSYLRTVARNLFLMAARKSHRQPQLESLDIADSVWEGFTREDGGEGYLEALGECVEQLDGRARQAIDLRYRDNVSRGGIGQALAISEDGVKSLLRRTREVLRQCVEKRLAEE